MSSPRLFCVFDTDFHTTPGGVQKFLDESPPKAFLVKGQRDELVRALVLVGLALVL